MIKLTLCARCGYKILSPSSDDPEIIRAAKKVSQREKFHFAPRPYEYCPREDCEHSLKDAGVQFTDLNDPEVKRTIAKFDKGSNAIGEIRKAIDGAKTMLDRFPSIDLFTAFVKTAQVDLRFPLTELLFRMESYRDTVNEFTTDLTKLIDNYGKGKKETET